MQADSLVLDFDQLKMLSGDDDEFMIEILEMIIDQSPSAVSRMNSLFGSQDFGTLASAAHQYKSTVNILGNPEINNLLKDLENTARDQQNETLISPLMEQLRSMCNDILQQVQGKLTEIQSA